MADYYVLKNKKPVKVDMQTWAVSFENSDRHVADTTVGGVRVSTVFLGLDHQFGIGPPVLFETLVFGGELDGEMDPYQTWAEADIGHTMMVQRVKKSLKKKGLL